MGKTTPSKQLADQIKSAIDKGDIAAAQTLLDKYSEQSQPTPKKRGRPPKAKIQPQSPPQQPIISPPTVPKGCVAPARDPNKQGRQPGEKIEKDGKTYTVSRRTEWTPPTEGNKFKDSGRLVAHEKLKYPERSDRRDPAQQIKYICDRCHDVVWLYPGQGPSEEMIYYCDQCLSRNRRR